MTSTKPSTDRVPTTTAPPAEDLPRMALGDHIDELRSRLIKSVLALVIAMLGVLPFKDQITGIYVRPYEQVWMSTYQDFLEVLDSRTVNGQVDDPRLKVTAELQADVIDFHKKYRASILDGSYPPEHFPFIQSKGGFGLPRTLKALGGIEDMWVYMAATILFALALAAPVVIYQVWAFIAAGLYQHERRMVMSSLPWAFVLFAAGVLFGYFLAVPLGLFMLIQFMNPSYVDPSFSVQQYFGLLLVMTGALGVIFQMPLLMVVINRVGIISHAGFRKYWRHIVVGMFVVSAILTPPDVVTQLLMAIPMSILYIVGLVLTWHFERRRAKAAGVTA
ncbi:MAG: twin-arginine translocase subunit TatC [Planctomycetota bacterium]